MLTHMGEISKELKPPTRKMEKSLSLKKKNPPYLMKQGQENYID